MSYVIKTEDGFVSFQICRFRGEWKTRWVAIDCFPQQATVFKTLERAKLVAMRWQKSHPPLPEEIEFVEFQVEPVKKEED